MSRLQSFVLKETSPQVPALLRLVFGTAAFVRGLEAWPILEPLSSSHVLKVPYFEWLPSPHPALITSIVILWLLASATFALGLRTQRSGTLLTLAMGAGLFIDEQAYGNHLYLLTVMVALLTLAGPGGAWSFDARRGRGPERSLVWPLALMKIQVSIVYFFAAVAKFHGEYFSGRVLADHLGFGLVSLPDALLTPLILKSLAIASVLMELILAMYLWHPKRRYVAVGLGVLLHGTIPFLMQPLLQLTLFSLIMLSSYLLFLPREGGRRVSASPALAQRLRRWDWFRLLEIEEGKTLRTTREEHTLDGERALAAIADELPATYLLAPFLRLPVVSRLAWSWIAKGRSEKKASAD